MRFFLLFFILLGNAAAATSICEGIASRPGNYMAVLRKLPEVELADYKEIAHSSKPFNILAKRTKSIELNAARAALNNLLRKLRQGEWEAIRELARLHALKLQNEGQLVDQAQQITAPIVTMKPLFSYKLPRFGNEKFNPLAMKDGRVFFAYQDETNHVRVRSETGALIWSSPRTYERIDGEFTLYHPKLVWAQGRDGEFHLEIIRVVAQNRKRVVEIEKFKIPSGEPLTTEYVPLDHQLQYLENAIVLPNGERYFSFRESSKPSILISMHKRLDDIEGFIKDNWVKGPDGATYFLNLHNETELRRIKDGHMDIVWTSGKSVGLGNIFLSRSGRLFAAHSYGSQVTEYLPDNRTRSIDFPGGPQTRESFLDTKDGRVLYSYTTPEPNTDSDPTTLIFDITDGKKLIAENRDVPGFPHAGTLFDSDMGPMFLKASPGYISVYIVENDGLRLFGKAAVTHGSGMNTQWATTNKAFLLVSTKQGLSGPDSFIVYEVIGRPRP